MNGKQEMVVEIFQADEGYWEILGNGDILWTEIFSVEDAQKICAEKGWEIDYN